MMYENESEFQLKTSTPSEIPTHARALHKTSFLPFPLQVLQSLPILRLDIQDIISALLLRLRIFITGSKEFEDAFPQRISFI